MRKNLVLIIAGPTASGKSALALDAALAFDGEIINCDALQIYKDIPVIAATPTAADKATVPHHLYEIYDCGKRGNVVEWLELCVAEIRRCWQQNKLPIVVGGTGMYIDALINGVTPIPEVPNNIRAQVHAELTQKDLLALYDWLEKNDPEIAAKLHANDKTRITRAVEILRFTGKKVSDWYKMPLIQKLPEAKFKVAKIVPSLDDIENRCKKRLDVMVYEQTALAEVKNLLARNLSADLPALKALGVPELTQFIRGELLLNNAVDLAKLHTRQYAKRQRTWLKNKLPADLEFSEAYTGQPEYVEKLKNLLI